MKRKHKQKHKKEHNSHESEETKAIEDGLKTIYGKEKLNFSKFDKGPSRLTNILLKIVIALAILTGVSWGGFIVYNTFFSQQQNEFLTVEINAPDNIKSGEKTTISLNYTNNANIPLAGAELSARIPSSFQIENINPPSDSQTELIWNLGTITSGSDGSITIDGIWIAESPSSLPIQIITSYRPSNFNSDFQEIKTVYVNTVSSLITAEFSGPEEGLPGESLEYSLLVKNESEQAISNIHVALSLPQGFYLEKSEPELEAGSSAVWDIESLEAGGETEILLSGSFTADTDGFQYFTTTTSVKDNLRLLSQNTSQGFTDVLRHNFQLQLIANGGVDDMTVNLDQSLRITIALKNTGETIIDDASIELALISEDNAPVIWSQTELDEGSRSSQTISWNNKKIGDIEPDEKRLFQISLPISSAIALGQTDSFILEATVNQGSFRVSANRITVSVNSDTEFSSASRYFTADGAPLGNGPIPPKVGEKTSYRIYWNITNSLHDLESLKVSATLPPYANWENISDTDLGTIEYNQSNNTVTWSSLQIPKSLTDLEAYFTVSVTPTSENINQFIKLLSGSTMQVIDSSTKERIEKVSESLTSELIGDKHADGKGTVIE